MPPKMRLRATRRSHIPLWLVIFSLLVEIHCAQEQAANRVAAASLFRAIGGYEEGPRGASAEPAQGFGFPFR